MDFRHYDISVERTANTNVNLLKDLLELVKPDWKLEKIVLEDLSMRGCMNNLNMICRYDDEAVFVRINNEESIRNYNEELNQARKFVSKRGFSARLLCTFNNGFVEECLEGEAITWETGHKVHDDAIKRGIIAEMARYHARDVLDEALSVGIKPITPLMRKQNLEEIFEEIEKCGKVNKSVLESLPGKDVIMNELDVVNAKLDEIGAEKSFCHSDINAANVFVLKNGRVMFTDYESVCISYSVFDIASYFMTVNCELGKSPMETYPDDVYRRGFCRQYLAEKRKIVHDNSPVTDEDVDRMERDIQGGLGLAILFFITFMYMFLTNRLNTQLMQMPAEQTVVEIQRLWQAYWALKKAGFKQTKA